MRVAAAHGLAGRLSDSDTFTARDDATATERQAEKKTIQKEQTDRQADKSDRRDRQTDTETGKTGQTG